MPTPLQKPIKREVLIDGVVHTATLSPAGVRLVRKGFRKGRALSWPALLAHLERTDAPDAPDAPDDAPDDPSAA